VIAHRKRDQLDIDGVDYYREAHEEVVMGIVFYYAPMSSSTRVHWALEELELPYEKVKVDLGAGEQRQPDFLKMNPNGKVPTMLVDGVPLFESLAILLYLGETYGVEKGLYPAPGTGRLEAFKWMAWGSVTVVEALSRVLRNTSDRWPAEQRNAAAGVAARAELGNLLRILDEHLRDRPYMLGDSFTLVDCAIATAAPFMSRMGIDVSSYGNMTAWVGRCLARPAIARVMSS
jgi:glutathione S-transferase